MKKSQKIEREFKKIRDQLKQIQELVKHTKSAGLWHHEAAIRKKIKALKQMPTTHLREYDELIQGYRDLLDEVSTRLLQQYNKKNDTNYDFEEIVQEDLPGYLSSGIISVLMTSHIPQLVAEEFNRHFPENPKDEYPIARAMKRRIYLHLGETNTGKTHNAIMRLKQSEQGVYLAPLRILALENYERLNSEGVRCNLLTGEEEIRIDGAQHISSTIEKLNLDKDYDVAVIDEIQLIEDSQRGAAWTRALLGLRCTEIHVCGALNAKEQLMRMLKDCEDEVELKEYTRLVPLSLESKPVHLEEVRKGDALVAFSKRRVLSLSRYYAERGRQTSVIYGDLPPEVRKMQYDAFVSGQRPVVISTDAIGMGVNLPIRRIIFTELRKFDGEEVRPLTSQEVKQIAGRAGRIGIYDVGYVASTSTGQPFIREQIETVDPEIAQAVLGPSEVILQIGQLPLREKLALWSTRAESLSYYRKMDVRDYILILDKIKIYKLEEDVQWKLMRLPFDVNNDELLTHFLGYVEEYFMRQAEELTKPEVKKNELSALEIYYQKINLYYSFSKAMNISFDEQWVYQTRIAVSERINEQLMKL